MYKGKDIIVSLQVIAIQCKEKYKRLNIKEIQ